jgi:hypothetical protein
MKFIALLSGTSIFIAGVVLFWYIRDLQDYNELYRMRVLILKSLLASECVQIDEAVSVFERLGVDFDVINSTQRIEGRPTAIGLSVQFEPVVAFSKDGGRSKYFLESGTVCLKIGA